MGSAYFIGERRRRSEDRLTSMERRANDAIMGCADCINSDNDTARHISRMEDLVVTLSRLLTDMRVEQAVMSAYDYVMASLAYEIAENGE